MCQSSRKSENKDAKPIITLGETVQEDNLIEPFIAPHNTSTCTESASVHGYEQGGHERGILPFHHV